MLPVQGSLAERAEVGLKAHHDGLGFRVAEAAIEFDDTRGAVGVDHQSRVEKPGVGRPLSRHAGDGGADHLVHDALVHSAGNYRRGYACGPGWSPWGARFRRRPTR